MDNRNNRDNRELEALKDMKEDIKKNIEAQLDCLSVMSERMGESLKVVDRMDIVRLNISILENIVKSIKEQIMFLNEVDKEIMVSGKDIDRDEMSLEEDELDIEDDEIDIEDSFENTINDLKEALGEDDEDIDMEEL